MSERRWVLTGSDARNPMSLDVVAESGPKVGLGERVEVMPVADHLDYVRRAGEVHDREVEALLDRAEAAERRLA